MKKAPTLATQEDLENEKIIKEAIKAKPTAFKSKSALLANINDNRRLAKDKERQDRQRNKFKKGELIQLPTTKKITKSQTEFDDEELALKFPVYHDILSEDDWLQNVGDSND